MATSDTPQARTPRAITSPAMATSETLQTVAGMLGNVLEWYDFGIYGFFSDTIAQVFFPPSNTDERNLVASYLVFGGAFLMRPLGGCITGHIGDKHGRKRALVFSLFCMSLPTFAMGFLPTYEMVGGWSTALLVACRLLQGFSVGGQLPSSLVYTLESKPREHWGYYGSMITFANGVGSVLGNLVGALIRQLLSDEQLLAWGWRVAFFSGILIAPVAIFLHVYGAELHPNEGLYDGNESNIEETSNNVEELNAEGEGLMQSISSTLQEDRPMYQTLKRENWAALLSSFLTPMLAGAGWYITFVWLPVYMETLLNPPVSGAFWINLLASVCGLMILSIVAGWLSDRVGRNKIMAIGAVSTGAFAPVMIWIISWGRPVEVFFAQWCIGVLLSFFCGPLWAWLPEKFPPKIRLTAASLGYNLGLSLAAGFSPAIATALVHSFGAVAPGLLYPSFAILALIGMAVSTKVHNEDEKELVSSEEDAAAAALESEFLEDASTALI